MRKICCLLFLIIIHTVIGLKAQVTIGDKASKPHEFSVLELISRAPGAGGLRMPHLSESERDELTATTEFQNEKEGKAMGLTIFNKDTKCIEYWNGSDWISRCNDNMCPPQEMPGIITYSTPGPVKLNEIFTASVPAEPNVTYQWSIPMTLQFVGTSTGNSVTLMAIEPGQHGLYNIGVIATNDCGNKSSARSGTGFLDVLNCEKELEDSDIDLTKIIKTNLADGSGTSSDPYKVKEGYTFTLTYPTGINNTIIYNWSLSQVGNDFFNIVAQSDNTITLRASDKRMDETCPYDAIGIMASNECGATDIIPSEIYIKIIPEQAPCIKPDPPTPISFSKASLLIGETMVASVPFMANATYTWTIPAELTGESTTNEIVLKAKTIGKINLSAISVTVTNDCGKTSDPAYGNGEIDITDPSSTPIGWGNIIGRTCFDVAEGTANDNQNGCGALASRRPRRTNFADRTLQDPAAGTVNPPYSGVQVYTFKPLDPAKVSNVRFVVKETPENFAVKSYVQNGNKLTVYFQEDLNQKAKDRTRTTAHKVYIYAIYKDADANADRKLEMTLSIQDCACCGAATGGGGWLNFQCHNLGANENKDPFTYHKDLIGYTYQWGRKTDGHQERFSTEVKMDIAQANLGDLDADGQVQASRLKGYFINTRDVTVGGKRVMDWRTPSDNDLWRDDYKTKSDPCPPGWRLPTQAQLQSVITSNSVNVITYTDAWGKKFLRGLKIGDALFLPGSFTRMMHNYTEADEPVGSSEYWTSTFSIDNPIGGGKAAYILMFQDNGNIKVNYGGSEPISYRAQGRSVRCVEE